MRGTETEGTALHHSPHLPTPAYMSKSTLCWGHIPMDLRMLSISEQMSQPRI